MSRKRSKKRGKRQDTQQVDLLADVESTEDSTSGVVHGSTVEEAVSDDVVAETARERGEPDSPRKGEAAAAVAPSGSAVEEGDHERPQESTEGSAVSAEAVDAAPRSENSPKTPERSTNSDPSAAPMSIRSSGEALARAKEMVERGRISEAIELYRDIVETSPRSLKARNNLGALLDGLGQHDLALVQFEAAEEIDPDSVEVLTNLGSTLGALSR